MKLAGIYKGIKMYSDPNVEKDMVYVIPSGSKFYYDIKAKRNGTPDMRFGLNKRLAMFKIIDRYKVYDKVWLGSK